MYFVSFPVTAGEKLRGKLSSACPVLVNLGTLQGVFMTAHSTGRKDEALSPQEQAAESGANALQANPLSKGPEGPAALVLAQEGDVVRVTLSGAWSLEGTLPSQDMQRALALLGKKGVGRVEIGIRDLGTWDSSLLAFVVDLRSLADKRGIGCDLFLPEAMQELLRLAFAVKSREGSGRDKKKLGFLESLGAATLAFPARLSDVLEFVGDIALALARLVRGKSAMRGKDFLAALYECSVSSLGIVAITNLLFGLILAFVGSVQLISFGAQIYVAGLVGIGMLRVMGAVMVGVVMSGRVGAAYAALIGTMQVNEEVDALETMGIPPVDFLVLPRLLALTLMIPLLTVVADLMGMVGGFLVGISILDLTPAQYIQSTINMVNYRHGLVGLWYATSFGMVIAFFGCYHGMRCSRSAQGVGRATTTAVVHSLVGIIVTTAIITIICNVLNI